MNIAIIKKTFFFSGIKSFFLALPVIIVTSAVHFNPSKIPLYSPFGNNFQPLILSALLFTLHYLCYKNLFLLDKKNTFLLFFLISFVFFIFIYSTLSFIIHRDYNTIIFQLPCFYFYFFISRLEIFPEIKNDAIKLKNFQTITFILFILMALWLLVIGYTLISNIEKRKIESCLYNGYNFIFTILMLFKAFNISIQYFRIIVYSKDDFKFEGIKTDDLLGKTTVNILFYLMQNVNIAINCKELHSFLNNGNNNGNYPETNSECEECIRYGYSVANCKTYNNIYNSINKINNFFSANQIGTVIVPENRRDVKTTGWKLKIYSDIKIIHKKS